MAGYSPNFLRNMLGLFSTREVKGIPTPNVEQLLGGKAKSGKQRLKLPENTPLSMLWNFFLTQQYDTFQSLQNRKNRYVDLDFAVKNSTIIQMAADLYADEAVQCEDSGTPVRVNAKSDIQTYIKDLLQEWGIDQQTAREAIWNKVVFGDSFDGNDIDEKEGVVKVTPLSVWDIVDRIEFDPSKLLERLEYFNNTASFNPQGKLNVLMNNLKEESTNISGYFNKYLLGFELEGGQMVSPWAVTHYRTFSMHREFAPWGRSQFINVLPAHRQLLASEGLMQVARASSFPRDFYQVATEPGATSTEKWEALEEFQEQLDNAGLYDGQKEVPSIGGRIIVPKELVEYSQLTNSLDLDAIADIEYERENLITGLQIPKGYFLPDTGGWGVSGQSLLQQFKPFGRKVFSHQSDYLAGLTEKIKLHLAITGKFDGWDTAFELIMDFPVIEESSERVQRKAEELTLAQNTLSTLKDILGVDIVPEEIVKDAFGKMTSLPQATVDYYVKELMKANEDIQENSGDEDTDPLGDFKNIGRAFEGKSREEQKRIIREQYQKADNRYKESGTKDLLVEASLEIKEKLSMVDGYGRGTHYFSSKKESRDSKKNRTLFEALGDNKSKTKTFLKEKMVIINPNSPKWVDKEK